MKPSFDLGVWIIGFSLLGGASAALLVGSLALRRGVLGLAAAVTVFGIGLAACILADAAFQHSLAEAFFQVGGHKRRAMRSFLPWSLGLIIGLLSAGALVRFVNNRHMKELQRENP